MAITPLPPAPLVTDSPAEFNTKAFTFVNALGGFVTETNALALEVDADAAVAASAIDASEAAVAAANFKGAWSSLSGALNIPASVSHNGSVYVLTANLADVTADEPGVTPSSKWIVVTIPPQTGNSGEFLTTNGTDLAWEATNSYSAIASGSLNDGSTVIINSDGTVSRVQGSLPEVFRSATTTVISATYDSTNQKVVIAYRDGGNSNYGTAIVGTVSGTSISFGTAVVFESASTDYISAVYDTVNQKVVIAYLDGGNSNYGTAIVGTVSGTSISFGTAVVFESASTAAISITYDSTNQKVVIAYRDGGNAGYGTAIVGTVSGTSISFGTAVVFESANTTDISATYDSTNKKVVIAYMDGGNSNYGTAIVGTVSGTSISFGTAVVFKSSYTYNISTVYDTANNKIVIISYASAIVGTVSGTSISFGTAVFVDAQFYNSTTYDSINNKIIIGTSSSRPKIVIGTVSGNSISFASSLVVDNDSSTYTSVIYDPNNQKIILAYADDGNYNSGTAVSIDPAIGLTNLTASNYIGISNGSYTNGQTAKIQIAGAVDDAQSGLTPGWAYYIRVDGTLSTSPSVPSVFAGTAVSSTKIIVKG